RRILDRHRQPRRVFRPWQLQPIRGQTTRTHQQDDEASFHVISPRRVGTAHLVSNAVGIAHPTLHQAAPAPAAAPASAQSTAPPVLSSTILPPPTRYLPADKP